MAFKAECGHCNVTRTNSRNNKHYSLGNWCNNIRQCHKAIKEGGISKHRLSKADIKRLENAGFEWNLSKKVPFDEHLKDLIAFKAEFGHCNVTQTRSRNHKHLSLGLWCIDIRRSYKAIKKGGMPRCKLSKANIQRLEKAAFEWRFLDKLINTLINYLHSTGIYFSSLLLVTVALYLLLIHHKLERVVGYLIGY